MKKIAVLGTGIMGKGIAMNFLKNGYPVFVWNRNKDRVTGLVEKGATVLSAPKDANVADIIFEVTANDESSRSVWLGQDGILSSASKDKNYITCATLSAVWTDELASECSTRGLTFFDMPMTGGRMGAESGKLIFLVGGDKEKLELIKLDLKAVSEQIIYFGKAGSGMRYKLLLNMLQAIHIEAMAEVLRIAKTTGMDVKAVGDALAERPGGTTTKLTWRDFQKEPDPINFSVQWIAKDLKYAKQLAGDLDTPALDDVLKKFQQALDKGLGEKDWTVITKL